MTTIKGDGSETQIPNLFLNQHHCQPFSEMACSKKRPPQMSNDGAHTCRPSKAHLVDTDMECHPSEKLKPLPIKDDHWHNHYGITELNENVATTQIEGV